jgi:hypothetical protein
MGAGHVEVGFIADTPNSTYEDGTPVASVAWWDEMGHGGPFPSPPRPFFRTMVKKESPHWGKDMGALVIANGNNGALVLDQMGAIIAGELQDSIINTNEPPLSPTTLILRERFPGSKRANITLDDVLLAQEDAAKGVQGATGELAKPLVWDGRMLRAVTWRVIR